MITFQYVWPVALCKQTIILVTIEQFYIPFFTFNTHWISSSVLNSHLWYIPNSRMPEPEWGEKETSGDGTVWGVGWCSMNCSSTGFKCVCVYVQVFSRGSPNRCASCMHDTRLDIFSEWVGISAEKQHKEPQRQHLIRCPSERVNVVFIEAQHGNKRFLRQLCICPDWNWLLNLKCQVSNATESFRSDEYIWVYVLF